MLGCNSTNDMVYELIDLIVGCSVPGILVALCCLLLLLTCAQVD
jgi:hypothetical protein